jgi:UDP-glucose 4-epimerase
MAMETPNPRHRETPDYRQGMAMTPTCLVLGTGLIGTFAARALTDEGAPVIAADRTPDKTFFDRFGPAGGAPLVTVDILDPAALKSLMIDCGADTVVLSAGATASDCARDTRSAWRVNVAGTATVAHAAIEAGIRRLVFISSFAVYGRPILDRVPETAPLEPISVYGQTKVAAELALAAVRAAGLELGILRSCGVYGPRPPDRGSHSARFVESALLRALCGQDLIIRASHSASDEYLYVKDLARAIALLVTHGASSPEFVFNVGSGTTTTAWDFTSALGEVVPAAKIRIERVDATDAQCRAPLDVSRVRQAFGFTPWFDLVSGLADYRQEIGLTV